MGDEEMKKFLVALMAVFMILPTVLNTVAEASGSLNVTEKSQAKVFTYDDILELEPYIAVKNGLFKFDSSSAKKDGYDKELVKMQKDYLSHLNTQIEKGILKAESNLEITSIESTELVTDGGFTTFRSCPGKSTDLDYHWWGVSRYMNDCEADRFGADMATVAGGYAGAGAVAAIWFPGVGVAGAVIASYAAVMAARISANNYGSGVYVGITYAAFFNIEPQ
jgi:hypothetical protein